MYREGRRNDKDPHTETHTCDLSDSVEDLQFLWIESTYIIVTVSVEERKVQKGHQQNVMHIATIFVSSGLLQNKLSFTLLLISFVHELVRKENSLMFVMNISISSVSNTDDLKSHPLIPVTRKCRLP